MSTIAFETGLPGGQGGAWRCSGFTLIELIVVIAIIALLISLLLPALTLARQTGQNAGCLSNQRQIAIAMQVYLNDHRDTYMAYRSSSSNIAWFWELKGSDVNWPYSTADYLSTAEAFFCPAHVLVQHPSWPMLTDESDKEYAIRRGYLSYGMTMGLTVDFRQPGWPEVSTRGADVLDPAKTILLADAFQPLFQHGIFYLMPYYIQDGAFEYGVPAPRHPSTAANVLWTDGHAGTVRSPDSSDLGSLYWQEGLTNYLMTPTYWDRY